MNSYLYYFLITPVLWIPFLALFVTLGCAIARHSLLKKQKTAPEGVNETTLNRLRVCVKVFGIIAGVTGVLFAGLIVLAGMIIAHM